MPKKTNYPMLTLKASVEHAALLRTNLGQGPFGVNAVYEALGYTGPSGASNRALAALGHFELLEKTSDGYRISVLANRIIRPTDEQDKRAALKEAASKPRLYKELMDLYAGERIPAMLQNILIHKYELTDAVARKAANIFKKSVSYANLLDDKGALMKSSDGAISRQSDPGSQQSPVAVAHTDEDDEEEGDVATPASVVAPTPALTSAAPPARGLEATTEPNSEHNKFELVLGSGLKATIIAPSGLSDADRGKLKAVIDLL